MLESEFGCTINCEKVASGPPGHREKSNVIVREEGEERVIACCRRIINIFRAGVGPTSVHHLHPSVHV